MRSHKRDVFTRTVLRVVIMVPAVGAALSLTTLPASAASQLAAPSPASFGILGPVGLIAVGLGVVGMLAGLARRRREALGRSVAARGEAAGRTTAQRAARVAETRETHVPGPSRPPLVERTGPLPRVQNSRAA